MTITLIITLVILAAIAAWALVRGGTRKPTPTQSYQMRYKGGDAPCVVCGRPTPYTLHGRPIHPEHREDVA